MIRNPLLKQQGIDRKLKNMQQKRGQTIRPGQNPAQKIRNADFGAQHAVNQFRTEMAFLRGQRGLPF
jgi:hypothetical protein